MKEIKFRGQTPQGDIVYGDLNHYAGHIFINDWRVKPESVSQYCGVDRNGREIYEGDEVEVYGKSYKVEMKPKYGLFTELKNAKKLEDYKNGDKQN